MNNHINNLTFEEFCQTIDNHFESKTSFLFVADLGLACDICDYIEEEYDLVAQDEELETSIEEYYVSVYFGENDEVKMYVESARGNSGKYKLADETNDYVDYFIGTGMSENEVDKYLLGDGTWSWFRVVEDEEPDDCDTCEDRFECDDYIEKQSELLDSEDEFARLVDETLNEILDSGGCPNCILEALVEFGGKCLSIGHSDAVDEVKKFLDS